MKIYRYRLDGPEPPPTVREVAVGPGAWAQLPIPRGTFAYLLPWYGNVWRRIPCQRHQGLDVKCRGPERCYHWFNGYCSSPWASLRSRAVWAEARDTAALTRLHAAYRHH